MVEGILYIIKNDINSKVYIGKTYNTLKRRWRGHLYCCNNIAKKNSLYCAMRKYGAEHFYIGEIGRFAEGILEEKEKEYIQKYNSYREGYNDTLGGDGGHLINIDSIQLRDLINYGLEPKEIADMFDVNVETIYIYMEKLDIRKRQKKKQSIIAYNKDWLMVYAFRSYNECWEFIKKTNNLDETKKWSTLYRLNIVCKSGEEMLGYKWQKYSDLVHYKDGNNNNTNKSNTMIFNTYFDREYYKKGAEAIDTNGIYHVVGVKRYNNNIKTTSKLYSNNRCEICNSRITSEATMCIECYNKNRKKLSSNLSKDELQSIISKYSYEYIGRTYNVSGKTIRKLADSYGIAKPIQQKTIANGLIAFSRELNIVVEFSTFIKAAKWMIDNEYIVHNNARTLSYYISKACNTGISKYGFYWYNNESIDFNVEGIKIYSENDVLKNTKTARKGNSIKLEAYSELGEFIETFNSATLAAKWLKESNRTKAQGIYDLSYRISKAADAGKTFCNVKWKKV